MKLDILKDPKKIELAVKITVSAIIILLIVSLAGIWIVNILMNEVLHNRKEVVVPDIVGMTINDALTLLSEKGLSLEKVAEKYDVDIPAGSIISQSPPPGLTIREGKAIESVISSGGKVVFVPEIEQKSLRQAELLLRQAGLAIGEQTRTYSSSVKRDYIVSQEPPAGEVVEKNTYVNIVVSRGPAEDEKIKKMPNLLGKNIQDVEVIMKEFGLDINDVKTAIMDELNEGTVVEQDPKEGAIIDKNTRVNVSISVMTRSIKEVRDETVYYEVSQSGREKDIRIILEDDIGERIIYEAKVEGGAKIEVPVKVLGAAKAKIYVDDVLIKEKELEFNLDEAGESAPEEGK
ncbi:MAG: PASTA domain-containing protein [Elusimicrobia bacterium]|nr:PASTA domain-containing protein [Elusimicrobiota bacterium]